MITRWYVEVSGRNWDADGYASWAEADATRDRLRQYYGPNVPIHLSSVQVARGW